MSERAARFLWNQRQKKIGTIRVKGGVRCSRFIRSVFAPFHQNISIVDDHFHFRQRLRRRSYGGQVGIEVGCHGFECTVPYDGAARPLLVLMLKMPPRVSSSGK
jgi:hypothetical protein